MGSRLLSAILAAACFLLVPSPVDACSCVGGIPLCQSLWTTDAVFAGEVVDIAEIPEKPESLFSRRRVTFRVLEVWRGSVATTVDVTTGMGGGDCGYSFLKGGRYLVYAHANASGALSTGICSRTRLLSTASEDIAYLKQVRSQPSAAGRIYGRVEYQRDPDALEIPGAAIAGYTVELTGGGRTRTTTTQADGSYEFPGVPAGDYTVSLKVPATEDAGDMPRKTTLADPRGCAAQNFYVVPDGRIRVRLVDASGQPLPNLRIDLLNLDGGTADRPAWQHTYAETGADGTVELSRLRPRRYLLAVNGQYPPSSKSPYATSYFPGVATRDEARPVVLGLGERAELGEWVLPERLRERKVSGVVTWADGRPAVRAHVIVDASRSAGWRYWTAVDVSATTDAEGRFTITLLDGVPYEISAYAEVGEERRQVRTPRVEFTPGAGAQPLKLALPR